MFALRCHRGTRRMLGKLQIVAVTCCLFLGFSYVISQPYNFQKDYIEVYPDPTDPIFLQDRTPLYFGLIQSLGGPLSLYDGSGSVAGVKVALDRINDDPSILPGYTLHYAFTDSMCSVTESYKVFFSQMLKSPTKLAIIGAGCSPATEATAEISFFYNITQISCVSSSTELKNRAKFPYYFQMLNTEEIMAYAYYAMFKRFKWRRVTLIVQDENLFKVTIKKLKELFENIDGFQYSEKLFSSSANISSLGDDIFVNGFRIFLFATYAEEARELLCKAYYKNITFPKYLLLTIGWYRRQWWRIEDYGLTCTVANRESVLPLSLAFLNFHFLNEKDNANLTTDTGITGGEFFEEERAFLNMPPLNLTFIEYSQFCYDAVWTLAYALNNTINELQSNPSLNAELAEAYNVSQPFTLQDFNYKSNLLLKKMFRYIGNTSFDGITGPVTFGKEGIRKSDILTIFQFRNVTNKENQRTHLDWVTIGQVKPQGIDDFIFTYSASENDLTLWDGLVPYDGVPLQRTTTINISVTIIYCILAFIGIMFTIICFAFNFAFRKSKLIMLASSKLNYLILTGAFIIFLDIITFVVPPAHVTTASVLCNLTPWLLCIGYSLLFGTITMKMSRVYYIFRNPTNSKKKLKDWILGLAVLAMVLFDVSVLILYFVLSGVDSENGGLQAHWTPDLENPREIHGPQEIITENYVYICQSIYRYVFLGILFGYKMVLQFVSLILAFSIRKVKVRGLDDAKYVVVATYVISILLVVVVLTYFFLANYNNIFTVIFCTGLFVGTTAVLALVFGPLMVGLYKDPSGRMVFEHFNPTLKLSTKGEQQKVTRMSPTDRDTDTLRRKVDGLESELKGVFIQKTKVLMRDYSSDRDYDIENRNAELKRELLQTIPSYEEQLSSSGFCKNNEEDRYQEEET